MQSKKTSPRNDPVRETYRHGDLRRSLLEAGVALARDGGPEAIVLREVTRRAGVVPNAAYRHFASRDDLLQAVRAAALAQLAEAIEAEFDRVDGTAEPAVRARESLKAVGIGYLGFAAAEPGLFRTAFFVPQTERDVASDPDMAGRTGMNPFQLLGAALDQMVAAGLMSAANRPGAEYLAWSSVHGLATLLIDGPLAGMASGERRDIGDRLLDMVIKGL